MEAIDKRVQVAMFVFHNPTITDLANQFTNEWIDNVPTCGIVTLQAETDRWSNIGERLAVIDFDYPKRM